MFVFHAQDPYFKNPSDEEPFQDIIKYWMRDKVFAEQRLAGVNPITLMRVTTDRGKQIQPRSQDFSIISKRKALGRGWNKSTHQNKLQEHSHIWLERLRSVSFFFFCHCKTKTMETRKLFPVLLIKSFHETKKNRGPPSWIWSQGRPGNKFASIWCFAHEITFSVFITWRFFFADTVGIKWTELKKTLNQEFDWNKLIINTPNMPKITLQKVILVSLLINK